MPGAAQGTNGQSADSFRFAIRKQLTSHLCMRLPNKQRGKQATKRGYGATVHAEGEQEDEFGFVTLVGPPPPCSFHPYAGKLSPACSAAMLGTGLMAMLFLQDKRHTLRSYAAYADWVKAVHFSHASEQVPPVPPRAVALSAAAAAAAAAAAGDRGHDACECRGGGGWQAAPAADPSRQSAKRRRLHTYVGPAPSVDQIEAEFWRIVETPDAVYESLYGQVGAAVGPCCPALVFPQRKPVGSFICPAHDLLIRTYRRCCLHYFPRSF